MNRRVPPALFGDHAAQLHYLTKPQPNGCWEFTGYVLPKTGYGQVGRNTLAHRLAWEVANGRPVPAGMVVDHQCHNLDTSCTDVPCAHRRCVNPAHMVLATHAENVMRGRGFGPVNASKDFCDSGHELVGNNVYTPPSRPTVRICRACHRRRDNDRAAEHRAENVAYARDWRRQQNPEGFAIREWAAANGIECKAMGPIPRAIREAFAAANDRALVGVA